MAIQVADNFQYLGQKPLDARIKYATVADMAAVAASNLYDGIMAYVVATEKNYQWKSTNTVDPTLGKWREFQSGGSAEGKAESSAIAPVFDDTATYAAGDRVMYEDELYVFNKAHTGAWDAADADKSDVDSEIPDKLTSQQMQEIKDIFVIDSPRNGYPVLFDETGSEHFVGWYKYANGTKKPVYQKTFSVDTVVSNNKINVGLVSSNIDTVCYIGGTIKYTTGVQALLNRIGSNIQDAYVESGNLFVYNNNYAGKMRITVQYTKTTDQPQ